MPIGLGLHVLIALFFAVHAMRSGQDRYWLFILFAFPLLGSIVYALVIFLPEARHTRTGRDVARRVTRALDPQRELRLAQDAFETAETADNRVRLAEALIDAGRAPDAVPVLQAALRGIHADDPSIQVRLARALLESGRAGEARALLDDVIARNPTFRSQDGHLVYARAVAAEGDRTKAKSEFDTLIGYGSGFEPHMHYAETLHAWGEVEAAEAVRTAALARAKRQPAYVRRMNKPWLTRLQRLGDDKVRRGA